MLVDDIRLFGSSRGFPSLARLIAAADTAAPEARIHAGLDSLVVLA